MNSPLGCSVKGAGHAQILRLLGCIEHFARQSESAYVDLLLFPECFLRGYVVEEGFAAARAADSEGDVGPGYLTDALYRGQRFRALTILDEGNREGLAIDVATSIPGPRVVRVLEDLVALHGRPRALRTDNGPGFLAQPLVADRTWRAPASSNPDHRSRPWARITTGRPGGLRSASRVEPTREYGIERSETLTSCPRAADTGRIWKEGVLCR